MPELDILPCYAQKLRYLPIDFMRFIICQSPTNTPGSFRATVSIFFCHHKACLLQTVAIAWINPYLRRSFVAIKSSEQTWHNGI